MTTNIFNPKKALLQTRIIFLALVTGIIFFLVMAITMISEKAFFSADFSDPLFLALFLLCCTSIPAGFMISKKHFAKAEPNSSLELKFPVYQAGLIIRLATCEGVALFAIVCLLLSNNLFSLVYLFIAMTVFILYFPTPGKIGMDISLTDREIELFI